MTDYLKGPGLNAPNLNWRADHLPAGSHKFTSNPDINGKYILNPAGIGGTLGKAITIVGTAADIKTACEDASVYWVLILEGTYIIPALIAPTSYKTILGIGRVRLDWGGAAAGVMFRNVAATYITYEHLHWIKTGNSYTPVTGYAGDKIIRCRQDSTGNIIHFLPGTSSVSIIDSDLSYVRIQGGSHVVISGGSIAWRLELNYATELSITNCRINAMRITDHHTYYTHLRGKFTNCDFIQTSDDYSNACVNIITSATSLHTIYGLRWVNCTFEPLNNGDDCILLENDANLGVADMSFSHCEFYDALNVYTIPALPTVARWRFDNNRYESIVGSVYNFANVPSFQYTNDGSMT